MFPIFIQHSSRGNNKHLSQHFGHLIESIPVGHEGMPGVGAGHPGKDELETKLMDAAERKKRKRRSQ